MTARLRRSRTLAAAVGLSLLSVCASPPVQAQDAKDERPLQVRVDEAIDRGVAWMRGIQRKDGTFPLAADRRPLGGYDTSARWAGGLWDKGLDALCVYALAVSEVPADDPSMARGLAALRRHWKGRPDSTGDVMRSAEGISTYFVSLALLALDAQYNRGVAGLSKGPPDPKRSRAKLMGKRDYQFACELLDWLQRAQDPGGGSAVADSSRKKKKKKRRKAPKASRAPSPADGGGFSYECEDRTWTTHDHSNTQFALLGMKAAARLGVEVPEDMWVRSLRHWIAVQDKEGPEVPRVDALDAGGEKSKRSRTTDETPHVDRARGWSYSCQGSDFDPSRNKGSSRIGRGPQATMTSGGVSSLVICRSELAGSKAFTTALSELTEAAIRDGLAWLARDIGGSGGESDLPAGVPPELRSRIPTMDSLDDFYYLYGLERACMLAAVSHLGETEWWKTGAERILKCQEGSGAFQSSSRNSGNGRREIDSAFALLFLKRAVFRTVDKRVVTPTESNK